MTDGPMERRAPYWEAFSAFIDAEGTAYLNRVAAGGGWDRYTPEQSRMLTARAMLMHGIQVGLSLATLEPELARTVYDQLTRNELAIPAESAERTRLDHYSAGQRL